MQRDLSVIDKKYKDLFLQIITKHTPDCKVYLFGSRAKGTSAESSDVDLAIDCGDEISPKIMGLIKEDIEESTIPYFVDVVDFNVADEELKKQIIKHGILWKS